MINGGTIQEIKLDGIKICLKVCVNHPYFSPNKVTQPNSSALVVMAIRFRNTTLLAYLSVVYQSDGV